MQQSSETIGAIAGALAKAQLELSNPEKALASAWGGTRLRRFKRPQSIKPRASFA